MASNPEAEKKCPYYKEHGTCPSFQRGHGPYCEKPPSKCPLGKPGAKEARAVPEALQNLADLYAQRNTMYGDNYKSFGKMMMSLFPNGINLNSEEAFNKFGVFVQQASKLSRIAQGLGRDGKVHVDSCDDLSVYSQMLVELENEK